LVGKSKYEQKEQIWREILQKAITHRQFEFTQKVLPII